LVIVTDVTAVEGATHVVVGRNRNRQPYDIHST
jgi:hypothetical protein